MPITALSLTTRTGAGAALTQSQFDTNLTAIQTAVNALITQVAVKHNDDGTIKDGTVATAAKITDAIITLAKLAALTGADKGGFLRADASTGVIAAVQITSDKVTDSTAIDSTGVQTALSLGEFIFADVPAGDVMVWAKLHAVRNAGANGGTITLRNSETTVDETPTHGLDGAGTSWLQFLLVGKITGFAGGTLTLDLEFETSEASSDCTFGVDGEGRFGRTVTILAGL